MAEQRLRSLIAASAPPGFTLAGEVLAVAPKDSGAVDAPRPAIDTQPVDPGSLLAPTTLLAAPEVTRSAAVAPLPAAVPLPLQDPELLAEHLGAELSWMAEGGRVEATLEVSPDELGPVRIQMSLEGNTASLQFQAARADTLALIENALPQLRQQMAAEGLQLNQASFDTRAFGNGQAQGQPQGQGPRPQPQLTRGERLMPGQAEPARTATARRSRGRLDTWV